MNAAPDYRAVLRARRPIYRLLRSTEFLLVVFLALHVPLGLALYTMPALADAHALGTFAVGLWWSKPRFKLYRVAYVGAYIVGSEVLWRMTGGNIFWEYGKYATVALFLIALLRVRRLRGPVLPFFYFVLLLPSCVLTVMDPDLGRSQIRMLLSQNMSGPLSLLASAWFFSQLTLSATQLRRLFLAAISPILAIAAITVYATLSVDDIVWTTESNIVTSGGFGPNQVSSMLGLGALLALLYMLLSFGNRFLMFGLVVVLATQSALTFSRGGLYNAAVGALIATLYLVRDGRALPKLAVSAALLFTLANWFVLPRLQQFTEGTFAARFQDTDLTNREEIARLDLQIWSDNLLVGVGPGRAVFFRQEISERTAAHTEFSRMLAEHGLLGLAAIPLLLLMGAQRIIRAPTSADKALAAAMLGWACIYMLNAAMRLVAPGFVFGLIFASISSQREVPNELMRFKQYRRMIALKT